MRVSQFFTARDEGFRCEWAEPRAHPSVEFFAIEDADHVSVLNHAYTRFRRMSR
jgi:hypothetical protein